MDHKAEELTDGEDIYLMNFEESVLPYTTVRNRCWVGVIGILSAVHC